MAQDLRYAIRLLRKNPGFTAVAVCTLAIGIGANTAIFSITDAVLFRPLPYPESNRLVRIWQNEPKMGEGHLGTAPSEFVCYRDRSRAFSSLAGYQKDSFDLTSDTSPEHISAIRATPSLFSTLGIRPLIGRTFIDKEERAAVLSYQFWRRHYAEDPKIIGKLIKLNERPYEVIGVMPQGFSFPSTAATPGEPPALWVPITFTADQLKDWASSFDTSVIARLRPNVSLAQAQQDVKRVADQFQQEQSTIYSGNIRLEAIAEPWAPDFDPRTRVVLAMLTAVAGFVLLIACANIANLFLVRAGARQREMSIRRALGATGARLTRQIVTETAMVAAAGGILGCALAGGLLRWINTVSIKEVNIAAAAIDTRVLFFTLALCTVTCFACGLAPAWALRYLSLHDGLKQRQPGVSPTRRRIARTLVVAEIACCVILLIGSGLLVRSFLRILQVPIGFDPANTLLVRTALNSQRYSRPQRYAVEHAIEAKLASMPGVSATAITTHVPLADERKTGFLIDGAPPDDYHWSNNALVSSDFFHAMHIPLLAGRTFSTADTPESPLTAVINESMAKQYWRHQSAIGKGYRWGGWHITVIGVVGDVHVEAIDKPVAPTAYNFVFQLDRGVASNAVFLIRTKTQNDPMQLAAPVRAAIWAVDHGLPILGFSTLDQVVSQSLAIRRIAVALVGSFAFIALLLSLIGIYGVLSYAVTQRMQEMGVRLALGARPAQIKTLVIGDGVRLIAGGIVLGVIGGVFATRSISNLLYGVRPLDPMSFSFGVLLLFGVGLLASYLPARRAGRVDPMVALRNE